MASVASMALPGSIPTIGIGRIAPGSLFSDDEEREKYRSIMGSRTSENIAPDVKIKKVKVCIFDLSDGKQVAEYEKLWAELLEKTAKNEVVVEAQKDLVHRKDGTSYWMKYVEYVEFGDASEGRKTEGSINQ